MFSKNAQLLTYLIKNHERSSVPSLMKLCYLVDLVCVQESQPKVSDFEYKRYHYGPFDTQIYDELQELIDNGAVKPEQEYTAKAEEYVIYTINDAEKMDFSSLTEKDEEMTDVVLEHVKGYGAKTLTEITYKTKPMLKLGATIGGSENLNEPLDLKAS